MRAAPAVPSPEAHRTELQRRVESCLEAVRDFRAKPPAVRSAGDLVVAEQACARRCDELFAALRYCRDTAGDRPSCVTPKGCKIPARGQSPGPACPTTTALWPFSARIAFDSTRSLRPQLSSSLSSAFQGLRPWLSSATPLGSSPANVAVEGSPGA